MIAPGALLTREVMDPDADVLVITNMWPDEEKPAYGIFIKRQVDSLRRAGVGCEVLYVRGYRSSLAYAWAGLKLLWLSLRPRGRYRLVHAHGGETALSARCYLRGPVLASYSGGDLLGTLGPSGKLTRGSRVRRPILRAHSVMLDATITKSRQLEQQMPRQARMRNTVIPNGVDRHLFAPMDRREARRLLGWPAEGRVALFAANPFSGGSKTARRSGRSDKRYWLAEAACALARDELPDLELRAAAGVPPNGMPLLMNGADCLLLTSVSEGSPNAVKEAVMCNLPVITTRVGDVEEVLERVSPSHICDGTPEALSAALVRCLEEPQRSNGREVSAWLDEDAIAERILDVYRALVPGLAGQAERGGVPRMQGAAGL